MISQIYLIKLTCKESKSHFILSAFESEKAAIERMQRENKVQDGYLATVVPVAYYQEKPD